MFSRTRKTHDEFLNGADEEEQAVLIHREEASQQEIESLAQKYGYSEETFSGMLAGGTVLNHLMDKDQNQCGLNQSIYDAAIVMPQIGRTAGWPKVMVDLTIRSYIFLFFNFVMQIFILYLIATEEEVMDKFAGKMSLCNFGANIHTCPDGPDCIGPAGTNFEDAGRMYSYDIWSTRNYVRDSLRVLFPDKAAEIDEKIDPGEYGVENFWVRYICVFIFMMSVMTDLQSTMDLCFILWYIPAKAQPWMTYDVPSWASKEKVKEVKGLKELDLVTFKIAGMPRLWKIMNWGLIVAPKLFIWRKTAKYGVIFLMNTSGIEDVIVNVTALAFILNLDEVMFQTFSHKALHHILKNLQPWELPGSASPVDSCNKKRSKGSRGADAKSDRGNNGTSNDGGKSKGASSSGKGNLNHSSNDRPRPNGARSRGDSLGVASRTSATRPGRLSKGTHGNNTSSNTNTNNNNNNNNNNNGKALRPSPPQAAKPHEGEGDGEGDDRRIAVGRSPEDGAEEEDYNDYDDNDFDDDNEEYDYHADLLREQDEYENMTMEEIYQSVVKDQQASVWSFNLIPLRLIVTLFFTVLYVWEYYQTKCEASVRGGWISVTESLPVRQVYPILSFVLPWYQEQLSEDPYWTMPQPPPSSG